MRTRFDAVRDCFHDLLDCGRETDAAVAIWYDGRPVLDLTSQTRPDTLFHVYSVGKPVAALCLLLLVDRGRIGLDDPVPRHWPGFRTPATVRQVLAHTAGLPAFPVPRPRSGRSWPTPPACPPSRCPGR